MPSAEHVLTIVIPALNEEDAIGSTLERVLAARQPILEQTPVAAVNVVVVSDGSTDRTAEVAAGYPEILLVDFRDAAGRPENRGYGAAIKAGWEQGGGDLLAFLDADGTCDPLHFLPMLRELFAKDLDVVLGSRMGPQSQMPPIRRVGNAVYALLLGVLARRSIQDTASGMRIVRRRALGRLLPLPDRLHFTPAMSARALLDDQVRIGEVPMPYAERIGRSKLNVLTDGLRFLGVILSTALYVRPSRLTFPLAILLALVAALLLLGPAALYLRERRLEEWMIYRFLAATLLGLTVSSLVGGTLVAEQIIALSRHRHREAAASPGIWWRWMRPSWLAYACVALLALALALIWPGVVEYVTTSHVTLHWSRVVVASFVLLLLVQVGITLALTKTIGALAEQQRYWREGGLARSAGIGTPDAHPAQEPRLVENLRDAPH